ncbi:hypothetical protein MKX01_011870 [Papaver californicum]|nr:hypothetical protein MKX01_011870 [Papaver californicum]
MSFSFLFGTQQINFNQFSGRGGRKRREIKFETKDTNEPFIHSSQASQVFYCKDESRPDKKWHIVLESPQRWGPNVDAFEDPFGKKMHLLRRGRSIPTVALKSSTLVNVPTKANSA